MPEEIEVPTEGLQEKLEEAVEELEHEKAEEKAHNRWVGRVAVSSALLAVAAAIAALLAGHHANEAMFEEMKATNQWNRFQSKGIKASNLQQELLFASWFGKEIPPDKEGVSTEKKLEEYEKDKEKISEQATEYGNSADLHMSHHTWFARAVTCFQIAIALGAIAVLARRPRLWLGSLALGAAGGVLMGLGFIF